MNIKAEFVMMLLLSESGFIANLKTASCNVNVHKGSNRLIVVVKVSTVPYSSAPNTYVYKGTKTNNKILLPKLEIVNNTEFIANFLYFPTMTTYPLFNFLGDFF